jgi:E3 ubiquitin-protein ligase HUWE1
MDEIETDRQESAVADANETTENVVGENVPNGNGFICPPGMDPEVFNVLPLEMQQEVVNQARETSELAQQLDAGSSLDPEALAALPEDMRREVIAQEQQERRMREQAPADPSNAEEMDNASFLASLAPDLRNEILLTADEAFIASLPPIIAAEAQVLRERARANHRMLAEETEGNQLDGVNVENATEEDHQYNAQSGRGRDQNDGHTSRRKHRAGKFRAECDRQEITYIPPGGPVSLTAPVAKSDLKALLRLMYLLSPVRPHRLLQKVFQNLCINGNLRWILSSTFLKLLQDDSRGGLVALDTMEKQYSGLDDWRQKVDDLFEGSLQDFPPALLIGAAPEVLDTDGLNPNIQMIRRRQTNDTAASIAANLPIMSRGSQHEQFIPPVVATRMVDTLQQLCKNSPRFCLDMLVKNVIDVNQSQAPTGFESLLDLLEKPRYSKSSANLEQLLNLLELVVSPLSHLPKHDEEDAEVSQRDVDAAASQGKEWVDVPRVVVSQQRLQLLCSILRMETCKDMAFAKVNTIARRLCRVDANRGYVLAELASVARALGADAIRDLKALNIRMSAAVSQGDSKGSKAGNLADSDGKRSSSVSGSASTSVAVSTSTSELKLLRVLQTLQSLCSDSPDDLSKKNDGAIVVTDEMVQLLDAMALDELWAELTSCLKVVQVLEGVSIEEDAEKKAGDSNDGDTEDQNENGGKKLQNSVAGLLTRFLPSIEAFFVANASTTRPLELSTEKETERNQSQDPHEDSSLVHLVGGTRLVEFVEANKVLLNALIRNNSSLLDKGLRSLIQVPRCRVLLDFDVKRHWFKMQVRRLRQHASRRHGSLRLHIRRRHVFEDTYHQLRLRNAEEMRGRLHITFRNEQGVDAGGLSREFFGILAKEIFNPNYALFTSTEDGSTFQPNPNSSINPDHLSYFRFVGRIVGKAVSDGYLLDAHFTRSLYKHMLDIKPTHHDMEAIDPDYYKNLKTILEFDLGDLGLELTFSIEDHSFGRNQIVDLIPNGRNVPVTEENKSKYVSLVCQHRMTTAIASQIKAYLDGFYELVSKDLIQIFTPRELELLISGLPDIDMHDLKKNTDYIGWKATDKQIEWFWNVLFSLSRNQKAAFLQFVTGSSKVPLAGFGELPGMRGVQKFSIHKAGGSSGALMSAHTCFNSLDLPVYTSEEELRAKLLYAINEGAGSFQMA